MSEYLGSYNALPTGSRLYFKYRDFLILVIMHKYIHVCTSNVDVSIHIVCKLLFLNDCHPMYKKKSRSDCLVELLKNWEKVEGHTQEGKKS